MEKEIDGLPCADSRGCRVLAMPGGVRSIKGMDSVPGSPIIPRIIDVSDCTLLWSGTVCIFPPSPHHPSLFPPSPCLPWQRMLTAYMDLWAHLKYRVILKGASFSGIAGVCHQQPAAGLSLIRPRSDEVTREVGSCWIRSGLR